MKIYGLQKMTLLDFPGHVACPVFLGGCDFRCPYCHNYDLACGKAEPVMEEDELYAFLEKRRGLLDGVAVTGGEPLLSAGLPSFLEKTKAMGYLTKLDTNGYHPDRLGMILENGLADYVAMDIKNSPEKYDVTTGIREDGGTRSVDMGRIRESIALIMESGVDYEFRTTVVKELHEESDFGKIGELIKGAKRYFLQQFTDRESVPYENLSAPGAEQMRSFAAAVSGYVQDVQLRGVD